MRLVDLGELRKEWADDTEVLVATHDCDVLKPDREIVGAFGDLRGSSFCTLSVTSTIRELPF